MRHLFGKQDGGMNMITPRRVVKKTERQSWGNKKHINYSTTISLVHPVDFNRGKTCLLRG